MPENEITETEETVEAPEATEETEEFDAERAKAKIAKVNAEAANLRKRLKELEPLANKAKEIEDSQKSETERLREELDALKKSAADANRLRVALAKGLTEKQAARLVGSTIEELEADADELIAAFKGTEPPAKRVPGKPRENLKGGSNPEIEPEDTDLNKIAARMMGR